MILTNERDPLFGNTRDSLIYSKDYIQDEDPTNPYISPLYGNFSGFPPMLIQVGSYEMLLSDSELVQKKRNVPDAKCGSVCTKECFIFFRWQC